MARLLVVDRFCGFAVRNDHDGSKNDDDDGKNNDGIGDTPVSPCACFTINGVRSKVAVKYDLPYRCFTVNGVRPHLAARMNGMPAYPCVSLRATCTCIGVKTRGQPVSGRLCVAVGLGKFSQNFQKFPKRGLTFFF